MSNNSNGARKKEKSKSEWSVVHLGSRMLHFKHLENRGTVVGDSDVANVVDEHLKRIASDIAYFV